MSDPIQEFGRAFAALDTTKTITGSDILRLKRLAQAAFPHMDQGLDASQPPVEPPVSGEAKNCAAEANAALAALRKVPHNGKMYQADDVDYLLALAETMGRGLGAINPKWFRTQAKLVAGTLSALATANERAAKAEKFKAYVHKRMDDAGVPVDPDSPHKAEGCRVGGRLDWIFERAATLQRELDAAKAVIDKLPKTADGVPVYPGMKVWLWLQGELCDGYEYQFNPKTDGKMLYSSANAAAAAAPK